VASPGPAATAEQYEKNSDSSGAHGSKRLIVMAGRCSSPELTQRHPAGTIVRTRDRRRVGLYARLHITTSGRLPCISSGISRTESAALTSRILARWLCRRGTEDVPGDLTGGDNMGFSQDGRDTPFLTGRSPGRIPCKYCKFLFGEGLSGQHFDPIEELSKRRELGGRRA